MKFCRYILYPIERQNFLGNCVAIILLYPIERQNFLGNCVAVRIRATKFPRKSCRGKAIDFISQTLSTTDIPSRVNIS